MFHWKKITAYKFVTTWGWVNNNNCIFIFRVKYSLKHFLQASVCREYLSMCFDSSIRSLYLWTAFDGELMINIATLYCKPTLSFGLSVVVQSLILSFFPYFSLRGILFCGGSATTKRFWGAIINYKKKYVWILQTMRLNNVLAN